MRLSQHRRDLQRAFSKELIDLWCAGSEWAEFANLRDIPTSFLWQADSFARLQVRQDFIGMTLAPVVSNQRQIDVAAVTLQQVAHDRAVGFQICSDVERVSATESVLRASAGHDLSETARAFR